MIVEELGSWGVFYLLDGMACEGFHNSAISANLGCFQLALYDGPRLGKGRRGGFGKTGQGEMSAINTWIRQNCSRAVWWRDRLRQCAWL